MRIWDIDPGFLNRQSLLGEHRELHGLHSVVSEGKSGYSRHPETLRWASCLPALALRHALLVGEMRLRGFNHHTPLEVPDGPIEWPAVFIDRPAEQFRLLHSKYVNKEQGRISLPTGTQGLWASHKYSVMARDPAVYRSIGRTVASQEIAFDGLSELLVSLMRTSPTRGRLANAVAHMWGYVADRSTVDPRVSTCSELLKEIQERSQECQVAYLLNSTALGELGVWCD